MMKRLLFFLFLLSACEVLEEDISDRTVSVVAPANGVAVRSGTVDFRWEAVDYAAGYEFTLVSPSFETAARVVADTVIWSDTLARHYGCRVTLAEGEYAWRVTGFNGGYATRPAERKLTVLPAPEP